MSDLLVAAVAGNAAGGGATYVEDVFSTYLYTGNGRGTVVSNGINLAAPTTGVAAEFNNGYVQIPGNGNQYYPLYDYTSGSQFTIEFFLFPVYNGSTQYIFDCRDTGAGNQELYCYLLTSGNVQVRLGATSTTDFLLDSGLSSTPLNFYAWNHVAIVRATNGLHTLYINGTSADTHSYNYGVYQRSGRPIIGAAGNSSSDPGDVPFYGKMSNFRWCDDNLYPSGVTVPTSDLTNETNTRILLFQGDSASEVFTDQSGTFGSITTHEANNGTNGEPAYVRALGPGSGPFATDEDAKGGLAWIKGRTGTAKYNSLVDSERGNGKLLFTDLTSAEVDYGATSVVQNSDGVSISANQQNLNAASQDYASWTFAKQEKFFDVVTWTGTGGTRTISHNLNHTVGMLVMKATSTTGDWVVYHRGLANAATNGIYLNRSDADYDSGVYRANTAPTDSVFTVDNNMNGSGTEYVAYLFAHNNSDGIFGESGDQDIIKCGAYIGNSTAGNKITVGFEPQWLLIKNASASADWYLFDVMRGLVVGGDDRYLRPNGTYSEASGNFISVLPDGFQVDTTSGILNQSGNRYIYTAIRRGPMKTPESGTEVFAMDQLGQTSPTPPGYNSPWPVDLGIQKGTVASSWSWVTRLLDGGFLKSDSTAAYTANSQFVTDFQNGFRDTTASSTDYYGWMFRRAPGFFDVVAYEGDNSNDNKAHNLGVVPELMIIKTRNQAYNWRIYHKLYGEESGILLTSMAFSPSYDVWNDKAPTSSEFFVTPAHSNANAAGNDYIAYLFATLPGVSKVGSYTGNGTPGQTIDCGFSSGARFVLIKNADAARDWWVFDTERGITSGNSDPGLRLNLNSAEYTGVNYECVGPNSSGFALTGSQGGQDFNENGENYIFLAIA